MAKDENVTDLILLVGSNPLPNYLAAMALKPAKIHLVHSEATVGPKKRLKIALEADLESIVEIDEDTFIADPFSASSVGEKIEELMRECNAPHLHYTGGTKVMSAHALKTFYENYNRPENASYVDEVQACLRFDSGFSRSLSEYGVFLTLDRILQLHGVKYKTRSEVDGGPCQKDVDSIASAVLRRPQLASCLHGERKRLEAGRLAEGKEMPLNPCDYELKFSVPCIPTETMKQRCFETWYKFIGGEWLEDCVTSLISNLNLDGNPEIVTGVNCDRPNGFGNFEVDVAIIRDQRSYFISCTTDMSRSLCKSKAFEIMIRSRHMGGDLARSALVSLLPNNIVEDLRVDISSAWGASNATEIFGIEDVRQWAGCYGSPDLSSLKNWLDS